MLVQNILQGCNYNYQLQAKLDGTGVRYCYELYLYELCKSHTKHLVYSHMVLKMHNQHSVNNCGFKDRGSVDIILLSFIFDYF